MKATKLFKVTYDRKVGGEATMIVKAVNQDNALTNAYKCCFTGKNFRNPVEVENGDTFSSLHPNGRCGRNRAN